MEILDSPLICDIAIYYSSKLHAMFVKCEIIIKGTIKSGSADDGINSHLIIMPFQIKMITELEQIGIKML